jgi:hypothetical protein
MIADKDISSGRVLRAFRWDKEEFKPNQHLMADEVLAIPIANRRALVDGGYLQIYAHQRQAPPWNPNDEQERADLRAWFVEQLDARDIERIDQDQTSFLKWFATLPSRCPPPAMDQHRAIRQIRAAGDKAQWRAGDPGPLRRHYPELEGVIPDEPPRGRGQYHAELQRERGDQQRRRAWAADDVRYLRRLWNRRGRWKGKQGGRRVAIEVAAERHDLTTGEVEDALLRGESAPR